MAIDDVTAEQLNDWRTVERSEQVFLNYDKRLNDSSKQLCSITLNVIYAFAK